MSKRVLLACEESQTALKRFLEKGFNAYSCDILPCSGEYSDRHIQSDVTKILKRDWDIVIAFPPCTYLTVTGNKWFKPEFKERFPTRGEDRLRAIEFFKMFAELSHVKHIAIENPVGIMSTVYRKPDQYIQPYMFGDPHSKKTGLWLKNLPKLVPTNIVEPMFHTQKDGRRDPIWHYESMKLPPEERSKVRSKTFEGIAIAMAEQWGEYILNN